jgi:hypothetical protein
VHSFFFGQTLAHDPNGLFKDDQKLLSRRRVVSIEAEFHDPLSLLSDALLPFAYVPAGEFQRCLGRIHGNIVALRPRYCAGRKHTRFTV